MILRNLYTRITAILLCVSCLAACGEGAPISAPVKIIAFGDSLTAGYQLPSNESVPARLQERFATAGHSGVRIINMGISGDTTHDGLSRLNLALEVQPDVVILALGANDMLRRIPVDESRENLEIMIKQMQAQNIAVILCGVELPASVVKDDYEPMFETLADRYDLAYYPNFLAGVQGKPDMNLQDGVHPNSKGAQKIADKLYSIVLDTAHGVAARK